jgi:hypothetical protein
MTNRRWKIPEIALLSLVAVAVGGVAEADTKPAAPPTIALFTGVHVLTRAHWSGTYYGNRDAASNAFVKGGASDGGELADILVPMANEITFKLDGKGKGCKFTFQVFEGDPWGSKPVASWHVSADKMPFEYHATPGVFFKDHPWGGSAIATRKLRVMPAGKQPAGQMCMGVPVDTVVTFVENPKTYPFHARATHLKVRDIELAQVWSSTPGAGPVIQPGTGFQFDLEGVGPVLGDVDLTLSAPTIKDFPTKTVKVTLIPSQKGTTFPAMIQIPRTLDAFPAFAHVPPGKHLVHVNVKGRGAKPTIYGEFNTHTRVMITPPPPAKGAAVTAIASDAPGYLTGEPEALKVTGTPGDLGTCDAFALQIAPTVGNAYQTLNFTNKKFPITLTSGADFAPLGAGVWKVAITPSGKQCVGTPSDALVQVEAPTANFVKERPTLSLEKGAFTSEQVKVKVQLPASYATWNNLGANIDCCETELYYKDKTGKWLLPTGGTINREFSNWDSEDSFTYAGVILYDEFMQNTGAVEWALRTRATGTGRQFAWSNLARFTVK